MKQFHTLGLVAGDAVRVVAECKMRGVVCIVPNENKTNIVFCNGDYVSIENRNGRINAYHTGYCYGDPDEWEVAS